MVVTTVILRVCGPYMPCFTATYTCTPLSFPVTFSAHNKVCTRACAHSTLSHGDTAKARLPLASS